MFESANLHHSSGARIAGTFSTSLLLQLGLLTTAVLVSMLAPVAYPEVAVISISPPAPRFRDAVRIVASSVAPRAITTRRPTFYLPRQQAAAVSPEAAIFDENDLPSAAGYSSPIAGTMGGTALPFSLDPLANIKPIPDKPNAPPKPNGPAAPQRISRGGDVQAAQILHRVTPVYPPLARQARIQGSVVLHAIITREGRIAQLRVLSGHPLLIKAALDAVQQWLYRPTYLNGSTVEVDAPITVNFILGQ